MAKPVLLRFKGSVSSFEPIKVDRSKVYGMKKRIAIDSKGRNCTRAALSADGSQLIKAGMIAQGYFTSDGFPISRSEMVGIDINGNTVELKPSTLGIEQDLHGPVDPIEVLEFKLQSLFWLNPIDTSDLLAAELNNGSVFKCHFNFSAGLELETAFILANPEGVFAIVGKTIEPKWVEESQVFLPDQDEDEEDELDFESL
jgi:hypothetical protein